MWSVPWNNLGSVWNAPTTIPERRRRRKAGPCYPEDEPEIRPEFDFGPPPSSIELAHRDQGAAYKTVSAFYYLVLLVFVLPFLLVLGVFTLSCILALWRAILP